MENIFWLGQILDFGDNKPNKTSQHISKQMHTQKETPYWQQTNNEAHTSDLASFLPRSFSDSLEVVKNFVS